MTVEWTGLFKTLGSTAIIVDALAWLSKALFNHLLSRDIERFMVRTTSAIKTHFFSAIRAFTQLELMRAEELIENWYEVQRNLFLQVARDFILQHLKKKVRLKSHNQTFVNA